MSSPPHDARDPGPPPLTSGTSLAGRFVVRERFATHGDVHLFRGDGDDGPVRIAAWRYRGAEPLPRFLKALEDDGEAWAALGAASLVPTRATGRAPGGTTCFWIQDEPGGPALSERLAVEPVLAPEIALSIALRLGHGLVAAGAAGLVHGDLDPAQVRLVGPDEEPMLAWGGLALRLEHAGMDAGRGGDRGLAEVAPEVLAGEEVGAPADVYGLAALLFRMLSGQPPFLVRRGGPAPGLSRGETLPPLPGWVAASLEELLARALSREPGRRPDEAEWIDGLQRELDGVAGTPAPAGTWAPRAEPPAPRPVSEASEEETEEGLDPALANTPPSAFGRGPQPAPPTGMRSVNPTEPKIRRAATPVPPAPRGTPAPVAAPPPAPTSSAGVGLLGLAVLVLALAVVLLAALSWYGRTPSVPPVAVVPVPVAAPPPAPPPPAPAAPAVLTLRTDPPGAEVFEAERSLGTTPLELVLEGGPADPPRELELRLKGYATHTVRQPWSSEDVMHSVPLQKLGKPTAPKPAAPKPTPTGPKPPETDIREER